MALGTPVAVEIAKKAGGGRFFDRWNLPLDNSYPAGGYTLVEEALRLLTLDEREIISLNSQGSQGFTITWNAATNKLMVFRTDQIDDPEEEVPAATDLSAITLQIMSISK